MSNFCLQCGKPIEGKKKFCNNSCAATYNNSRRNRKPWSEDQHKKVQVRVEQVCKYCGKKTGKIVVKSCQEGLCKTCKPYEKHVQTYKKLNIPLQEGLDVAEKNAIEKILQLYVEDRLSSVILWEKYKIGYTTLRKYLKTAGNLTRSKKESSSLSIETGRRIIPAAPSFKHGFYTNWEGKKVFYRSSYELEYAIQLDEQKVSYNVEDLRIRYFDTQANKERIAIPDFHLLDSKELVEIKSSWTYNEQNMRDKFKAYREAGYVPRLFLDKKEIFLT